MIKQSANSTSTHKQLECEILIVGSGASGSLAAYEFAKRNLDVLLVEEGDHDSNKHPTEYENFREKWRHGGITACFGKPPITYAEGRCIGGSTEINSGLVQKCPDKLLDQWQEEYDIEDFSSAFLAPYYREIFRILNASSKTKLSQEEMILAKGGIKNNWQITNVERAERDNQKQSMSKTLIPRYIAMGGKMVSKCKITELKINSGQIKHAKGYAINSLGQKCKITIKAKYIFLCCGAIQTPFLLRRSGLTHNIGNHLKIHPTIKAIARYKDSITAPPFNAVPQLAITEFMPDIRIGGSVMKPGFIAMNLAEDYERRKYLINNIDKLGVYYAMIRPKSSGQVIALPNIKDPIVRYNLSHNDWMKIRLSLDYLMQAMFQTEAIEVFPSIYGSSNYTSYRQFNYDIDHFAKKHYNLMTIHLFSSCPMGENRPLTAVDSFGKLHNMKNLFVLDSSIIPDAPGTNPQATIMAIALRNIRYFLYNNY